MKIAIGKMGNSQGVIISPAEMHDYLRTVIVAPRTTGSRQAPFHIPVTFEGRKGLIPLDQIRTLGRDRLARRLGAVTPKTLSAALATLRCCVVRRDSNQPVLT